MNKAKLEQHLECAAPKRWSKYTTAEREMDPTLNLEAFVSWYNKKTDLLSSQLRQNRAWWILQSGFSTCIFRFSSQKPRKFSQVCITCQPLTHYHSLMTDSRTKFHQILPNLFLKRPFKAHWFRLQSTDILCKTFYLWGRNKTELICKHLLECFKLFKPFPSGIWLSTF